VNKNGSKQAMTLLKQLGGVLGLLQQNSQDYLQEHIFSDDEASFTPETIEKMILQRLDARKNGDYSKADDIRKQLSDTGIILEDGAKGTTWRRE
jgi:cysteinyl-tRNA synthetase